MAKIDRGRNTERQGEVRYGARVIRDRINGDRAKERQG
jgi:hypothetical protein